MRKIVSHPPQTPPPILKPMKTPTRPEPVSRVSLSNRLPPANLLPPISQVLPSLLPLRNPSPPPPPVVVEENPNKRKQPPRSVVEPPKKKVSKKEKGLRQFSMKVCEKVQLKGRTSYVEVANELVTECLNRNGSPLEQKNEEKNIRRRVYDALNVLMALNIIEKGKKEIIWKGLDQRPSELTGPFAQKQMLEEVKNEKKAQLQELLTHQTDLSNLIARNEKEFHLNSNERIELPFIIVNTNREADIDCEINPQETRLFLNFNMAFEIHDDHGIIKRILQ